MVRLGTSIMGMAKARIAIKTTIYPTRLLLRVMTAQISRIAMQTSGIQLSCVTKNKIKAKSTTILPYSTSI